MSWQEVSFISLLRRCGGQLRVPIVVAVVTAIAIAVLRLPSHTCAAKEMRNQCCVSLSLSRSQGLRMNLA